MAYIEADGERRDLEWLFDNAAAVKRLKCFGRDLVELPPALPAATHVRIGSYLSESGLRKLPELPSCYYFRVTGMPELTSLPDLPAVSHVTASECPALPFLASRPSSRGNVFVGAHVRWRWRICVGVKTLTIADARARWGVGTNPRKPAGNAEALALAEEVFAKVLSVHPEAARDEVIDDPDCAMPIDLTMRAVDQTVNALVNLGHAMRAFRG